MATPSALPRTSMLTRFLAARIRLVVALLAGIVFGFALPAGWGTLIRSILGLDLGTLLYLVLAWSMMLRAAERDMRRRAQMEDEARWVILILCAVTAAASLCALPALLSGLDKATALEKSLHLGLSIFTILASWFFLQTIFTLHYAHEYYRAPGAGQKATERGGLNFAGTQKSLGYTDFAYFSFTIGMTAQTSDTSVTTGGMRRLTLVHAIVSFFFNTGILALTINLVAGLI